MTLESLSTRKKYPLCVSRQTLQFAKELWGVALQHHPTAALVCSLGELLIEENRLEEARQLYDANLKRMTSERQMTEVYLSAAWLEEKYFRDFERATALIEHVLSQHASNSRAQVALARLEGRQHRRRNKSGRVATRKRLAEACINIENGSVENPEDGRLFNAWANLEVKAQRYDAARTILLKGMERCPQDSSVSPHCRM